MDEEKHKSKHDNDESSQESAKKKKKMLPRTDEEVLEVLKSWRERDKDNDGGDLPVDLEQDDVTESVEVLASSDVTVVVDEKVRVYNVIYGKNKPYKKHKTFEFDGTLVVKGSTATLKDSDGIIVTRCSEYKNNELEIIKEGSHLVVGDQLCEICDLQN